AGPPHVVEQHDGPLGGLGGDGEAVAGDGADAFGRAGERVVRLDHGSRTSWPGLWAKAPFGVVSTGRGRLFVGRLRHPQAGRLVLDVRHVYQLRDVGKVPDVEMRPYGSPCGGRLPRSDAGLPATCRRPARADRTRRARSTPADPLGEGA